MTAETDSKTSELEVMTELLEAGVHYGHQTKRWNPKMKHFIFEERNGIYIIDLTKTLGQLQRAAAFLQNVVNDEGSILFVGCKKQAQEAVKEAAQACGQYFVNHRWLGGTLTNLQTIRQSVRRYREIEAIEKSPNYSRMNKKEAAALRREGAKIYRNLEGLLTMEKKPRAMVVVDTNREHIAIAEANILGIPIIAIVDTNSNPDLVNYPIAGNDDAIRSIRVILQKLVDSIRSAKSTHTACNTELEGVAE